MILGRRLGYGMRLLYELASSPGEYVTVREVAERCGAPELFLRRILMDLRKAGYTEAQKGRAGGFRLVKNPDEVKLAEMLNVLEGEPVLVLGKLRRDGYIPEPDSPTYQFWANVEKKFLEELGSYTLADLTQMAAVAKPKPKRKAGGKTGKKAGKKAGKKTGRSGKGRTTRR